MQIKLPLRVEIGEKVKMCKNLSENCSSANLNSAKFAHFDPLIREIKFRKNFFP